MADETYYIYQLIDPRNSKPFYVGKGKGKRMYDHENEANGDSEHPKCHLIREIKSLGYAIEYNVVKRFEIEDDAYDYEEKLIDEIGLHNLTNKIRGGRFCGYVEPVNEYLELVKLLAKIFRKTNLDFNKNTMKMGRLSIDITEVLKNIVKNSLAKLFKEKGNDWVLGKFKEYNIILLINNEGQPTF
jgi:hypothetical protein